MEIMRAALKMLIFYLLLPSFVIAQVDTIKPVEISLTDTATPNKAGKNYKNVVRYNLSGPLLFGFDYFVLGYERVLKKNQSFSINGGQARFPKLISISTDSFSVSKDRKNTGYNISVDYRFYLSKENKYPAPRGVYIGPYFSLNRFQRDVTWDIKRGTMVNQVSTDTKFDIYTVGMELGYQFAWKRFTLDFLMVGPGLGSYNLKTTFDGTINPDEKEQLVDGLQQLITEKFPGMNFVFAENEINSDGVMDTWTVGYRFIIHFGFRF
jgi:hypothetical protein